MSDTNNVSLVFLFGHENGFSIELTAVLVKGYQSSPMAGKHTSPSKDTQAIPCSPLDMYKKICSSNPNVFENKLRAPSVFPHTNDMYRTSSCQSSHTACPKSIIYYLSHLFFFRMEYLCDNRVMITIWTILQWRTSLFLHWLALSPLTWMNTPTIQIYHCVLWQSDLRSLRSLSFVPRNENARWCFFFHLT